MPLATQLVLERGETCGGWEGTDRTKKSESRGVSLVDLHLHPNLQAPLDCVNTTLLCQTKQIVHFTAQVKLRAKLESHLREHGGKLALEGARFLACLRQSSGLQSSRLGLSNNPDLTSQAAHVLRLSRRYMKG